MAKTSRDRFVNPYAFVPLPQAVERRSPPGHSGAAGRTPLLSGRLTVTWTLLTPLLLPLKAREEGWVGPDGEIRVPGSSLKGAIRSLHETLFNGCLRVFDSEFLPGYRVPARSGAENGAAEWILAVVTRSRDGVPEEVQPCGSVEWVESISLREAYRTAKVGHLPRTGDLIGVSGSREFSELRQADEIRSVSDVARVSRPHPRDVNGAVAIDDLPDGRRVLLVTDTSVRKRTRDDGTPGNCFWAAGVLDSRDPVPVSGRAVMRFRAACDAARDRQVMRRREREGETEAWRGATKFERVQWQGQDVGERALATGFLHAGDVVWVRTGRNRNKEQTEVEEIRLAKIWRTTGETTAEGKGRAGTRVPRAVHPCTSPTPSARPPEAYSADKAGLCLSCEIFGSADTSGDRSGEGRQDAYAGHVSVGAARSNAPVRLESVSLAPLGAPRLGAGVFSLTDRGVSKEEGDVPSHWGSALDDGQARPLRGRKYYWHVDPEDQAAFWSSELARPVRPRYRARPHQVQRKLSRAASLVPAGTVLEQEITFDGIDAVAVSTLLTAIEPGRLLGHLRKERTFASHLGGGKPFGLGAVSAQVTEFTMWPVGARYLNHDHELTSQPPAAFSRALSKRVGSLVAAPDLARMLDTDGLGEWHHHVAYPPGGTWDEIDGEAFDQSYRYFGANNGERLARDNRPWAPLPPVMADGGGDAPPDLPVAASRKRRGRNR